MAVRRATVDDAEAIERIRVETWRATYRGLLPDGLIEQLQPRRAILTNLHSDLDYDELRKRLPPHVEPAYDGLRIELSDDAMAG